LPEPIPATQSLAVTLLKAIQSGEAGSDRYCHPRNVAEPAAENGECGGAWHVVGYAPVRDPFTSANLFMVVVDVPEDVFLRPIERQRRQGISIAALMAALTVVASLVVARTLAQPIDKLAAAAQNVENDEPFEPQDIATVTAQGDEIGHLARVFSDMVISLRARVAELRTVYEIGQDITATLEVDETLQAILDRVRDVIAYDAAEITLFDQLEKNLIVTAWIGAGGFADTRGRRYELSKGFTGLIGQERRSLLVADAQADEERKAVTVKLTDDAIVRSLLGVPLLIRDRLVGTLELTSKRVGAFNEDDQRLLETIAPQAAIAIEKAQQVREREQKLKNQIKQLRIEIDEVKRQKQVEQIVETDYFQTLREKARSMRARDAGEPIPTTGEV
ncbi:MAG: GAF domain-containing protein, partial [Chloroflexota bacterium]|nr:GAF domain-containing protein [Chloroflexota bacterium]